MRLRTDQRGQGMTEYIILVSLIAVAAIVAVRFFGDTTKEGFETAAQQVGGVTQSSGGSDVQGGLDKASNVITGVSKITGK